MLKLNPIFLSVTILVIASLACYLPGTAPVPDQDLVGTMVAQTIVVGLTQGAPTVTPISIVSSPAATFTSEVPTFSPVPTLSPTPTLTSTPPFTPTPLIPMISVSVPTNCRVGPGKVYDRVGALLVGETAEVVGRDPSGNYWFIRNPDHANDFCWLWGEYATLTGNYTVLPMFTPPPTPTPAPAFEMSYEGRDTCAGWWVDMILKNTGGIAFRSMSMLVKDLTLGTTLSLSADSFTDRDSCTDSFSADTLAPGSSRIVSSPAFNYDPHGNKIRVTITLCSNKGLNGMCVTDTVTVTP